MDYEKKYKESLERAREHLEGAKVFDYKDGQIAYDIRTTIYGIFPELKESEDERIRKELIFYLGDMPEDTELRNGVTNRDVLAWLEKQGEQKPTNKIEPKFKNGQWVVWQNKCYKVNYNGCGYELIDQNGLSSSLEYGTVDTSARLWDITKDAKDGGVLVASDDSLFIFAKIKDNSAYYYFSLCTNGSKEISDGTHAWETAKGCHPATKEQRDTLMKAMTDAGWEFDFEKKELKKIESTDKYKGLTDFERTLADICIGWIGEELGWKQYIKDNADVLLKIAAKKFNSVQDVPFEQNPAWSEDDTSIAVNNPDAYRIGFADGEAHAKEEITTEWSEDDEVMLDEIIDFFENGTVKLQHDLSLYASWLKSLKERYTWKPSEIQLQCLYDAIEHYQTNGYTASKLNELYEQIAKIYKL